VSIIFSSSAQIRLAVAASALIHDAKMMHFLRAGMTQDYVLYCYEITDKTKIDNLGIQTWIGFTWFDFNLT